MPLRYKMIQSGDFEGLVGRGLGRGPTMRRVGDVGGIAAAGRPRCGPVPRTRPAHAAGDVVTVPLMTTTRGTLHPTQAKEHHAVAPPPAPRPARPPGSLVRVPRSRARETGR